MNRQRWKRAGWIALGVLAVIIILAVRHYASAQRDYWDGKKMAERTALKQTDMTVVHDTALYNGETSYWVIEGENEEGRRLYVWIDAEADADGEPLIAYADEGVTEQEVRRKLAEERPNARVVRIVPGYLDGEAIWEVFYKDSTDKGTRHFYNIYRFSDGELLQTLNLAG